MKRLIIVGSILLAMGSANAIELEHSFAGKLPVGTSAYLDKMASGFAGNVMVKKFCENLQESDVKTINMAKVQESLDSNVPSQYHKAAMNYFNNSLNQKLKAFSLAYQGKGCADLDGLNTISVYYGFN